jgi:signal transduction histidine kinase
VGDPDKIEQVLENLVSNALKYTNKGKITIHISLSEESVKVEVADTGIGISEDHINRLFDRFYRTDKARSRDKGGTGLGLAVVKSILNAHGSEINVKSNPGGGSRFWFTLPRET